MYGLSGNLPGIESEKLNKKGGEVVYPDEQVCCRNGLVKRIL
jgi:hypothetical protein